ncbi:hypothetical protein EYZ11_007355 [Aspergillus tanneri]|uniref:Uncharacterized protein n=1 Tax=Aspergillus tanneri TaxID=1220188 RepID=A0A4S3JD72_9EURO|nr:hypothetical protein EYZ11_007355 [Aspergillus tanneri]
MSRRANTAEYMLNLITGAHNSGSSLDWPEMWNSSPESKGVPDHLQELKQGTSAPSGKLGK